MAIVSTESRFEIANYFLATKQELIRASVGFLLLLRVILSRARVCVLPLCRIETVGRCAIHLSACRLIVMPTVAVHRRCRPYSYVPAQ